MLVEQAETQLRVGVPIEEGPRCVAVRTQKELGLVSGHEEQKCCSFQDSVRFWNHPSGALGSTPGCPR
jgi:hypothetical protein